MLFRGILGFAAIIALYGLVEAQNATGPANATNTTTSALNPFGTGFLLSNGSSGYVYNATGNLTSPESGPFTPSGGIGNNGSEPNYHPLSDYDYQSLLLVLYQENMEANLFESGLRNFSTSDFQQVGLDANDRALIQFMAEQERGHIMLIQNILGPSAVNQCNYTYPYRTVLEFVDFCRNVTRWGESTVYGFLEHLDSRAAAQLLLQTVTTEARQEMIFRQFEGLFPMPVWFDTAITQSMGWTLLAPYITGCSRDSPKVAWQNFPALNITNNPNPTLPNATLPFNATSPSNFTSTQVSPSPFANATNATNSTIVPGITSNRTVFTIPGQVVQLAGDYPGMSVGPNNSYTTNNSTAGPPRYAAWISQLNTTYTVLENVQNISGGWTATTRQPNETIWPNVTQQVVNGSMFIVATDANVSVSPFNISALNPHVVAGPAQYFAG
ncbi:ferritin-like domain-containing protein [Lipomyces kononenkoae]